MKKSTIVLSAILCAVICVGIAQVGIAQMPTSRMGAVQPSQSGYSQTLILTKQSLKDKNYEVAAKDAQKLLASANSPEQTGRSLIILGETFYRRKMYEQARVQWNKVLIFTKDGGDDTLRAIAHLGLARSYSAEGSFDKAILEYKVVMNSFNPEDENRESAIFCLALANAYYNTKQYDLAHQQLKQVIESTEDNPTFLAVALTRAGQVDLTQRRIKKSLADFNQVLAIQEVTPGVKEFAQRQADGVSKLIPLQLEEGGLNSKAPFGIKSDKAFDDKIDAFTQIFMDDFVVNDIIIKAL